MAAEKSGYSVGTVRKTIRRFNEGGWQSLITVRSPRGGDFLSRYDQGYWAERLARTYLDNSRDYRAIPYGTSRSEPFTDLQTFNKAVIPCVAFNKADFRGVRCKDCKIVILGYSEEMKKPMKS